MVKNKLLALGLSLVLSVGVFSQMPMQVWADVDSESKIPAENTNEEVNDDVVKEAVEAVGSEVPEEADGLRITAIDEEIAPDIDAVAEILSIDPDNKGIRQLLEHMEEAAVFPRKMGRMRAPAETEDERQTGSPIAFQDGCHMAKVSQLMVSKVIDGSAPFDEISDCNGNDASDSNGIVRVNDDLIYTLSFSTELGEDYEFHTINGTRLYVRYELPGLTTDQAAYDLSAMPWLKNARQFEADGSLVLTGYRELPDRTDRLGSYDVPGAGTVNCVVQIADGKPGQSVTPNFYAWLGGSDASAEGDEDQVEASREKTDSTIRISGGLFVTASLQGSGCIKSGKTNVLTIKGSEADLGSAASGFFKDFVITFSNQKTRENVSGADAEKGVLTIHEGSSLTFAIADIPPAENARAYGMYEVKAVDPNESGIRGKSLTAAAPQFIASKSAAAKVTDLSVDLNAGVKNGCYKIETNIDRDVPAGGRLAKIGIVTCQDVPFSARSVNYPLTMEVENYTIEDRNGVRTWDFTYGKSPYQAVVNNYVMTLGDIENGVLIRTMSGASAHYPTGNQGEDTANRISLGQDFTFVSYNNIWPRTSDGFVRNTVSWTFFDPSKVELVEKSGEKVRNESSKSPAATCDTTIYYLLKEDGRTWTSEKEMNTYPYSRLRYFTDQADARAAGTIVGVCVEHKNIRGLIAGDLMTFHTIFHMRQADGIRPMTTAMFTTGSIFYTSLIGERDAAKGDLPTPDNADQVKTFGILSTADAYHRHYVKTEWTSPTSYTDASMTNPNNKRSYGNTVLFAGQKNSISNNLGADVDYTVIGGRQVACLDMGKADQYTVEIQPAIDGGDSHLENLSCQVQILNPVNESGQTAAVLRKIYAIDESGKEVVFYENGKNMRGQANLSDFIPGTAGLFRILPERNKQTTIQFEGVSSDLGLPTFYATYTIDVTKVQPDSILKSVARIDDPLGRKSSVANGTEAVSTVQIIALNADVLKKMVDKAMVESGDTLTWTITYQNKQDRDLTLDLKDTLPYFEDTNGSTVSKEIKYEDLSVTAVGDAGSLIAAESKTENEETRIHAYGTLKPGETVTLKISARLTNIGSGQETKMINRASQTMADGRIIWSNAVETRIPGLPEPLTLPNTASHPREGIILLGLVLIVLALSQLERRPRKV